MDQSCSCFVSDIWKCMYSFHCVLSVFSGIFFYFQLYFWIYETYNLFHQWTLQANRHVMLSKPYLAYGISVIIWCSPVSCVVSFFILPVHCVGPPLLSYDLGWPLLTQQLGNLALGHQWPIESLMKNSLSCASFQSILYPFYSCILITNPYCEKNILEIKEIICWFYNYSLEL